ncbi:hypothetical protein PENSPDRAFT_96001 [Peniophora sp. CONT]|nr:hypothetical protein PENSPDRAFT_96001 [Peniophora sp. CONT]
MRNVLGAITRQAHARAETTRPGLGPNSRPTPSNSPPRFPHNARSKQNERSTSSANDNFEELWEEAVDDFFARTGVDLSDPEQDLYQRLQRCSSADTIVDALEDISQTFCAYRKGSERAERIRSVLRSVAHGVSVLIDAAAEGAASESFPGGKAVFVAIAVLIKATQGVSERFNTLLAILEKFGFYLSRLHIRLDIGFGPGSRRITVALLSKMVHAFALATQAMRQSRMRHLVSVLFDKDNETEAVAKQVEQLMEEDSRMGLVEIHRAVSQLSDGINETLAPLLSMQTELASIHADVHVVAQITQNGFAALSAQMESHPREHAVPHHLPPSATVPGDIRVASGDAELATRVLILQAILTLRALTPKMLFSSTLTHFTSVYAHWS